MRHTGTAPVNIRPPSRPRTSQSFLSTHSQQSITAQFHQAYPKKMTQLKTGDDLANALRLRDQFEAKLALGIAAFDRAGLWELDDATSAVAWLRTHGVSPGDAIGLVKAGRRAADVPALADAWVDGRRVVRYNLGRTLSGWEGKIRLCQCYTK